MIIHSISTVKYCTVLYSTVQYVLYIMSSPGLFYPLHESVAKNLKFEKFSLKSWIELMHALMVMYTYNTQLKYTCTALYKSDVGWEIISVFTTHTMSNQSAFYPTGNVEDPKEKIELSVNNTDLNGGIEHAKEQVGPPVTSTDPSDDIKANKQQVESPMSDPELKEGIKTPKEHLKCKKLMCATFILLILVGAILGILFGTGAVGGDSANGHSPANSPSDDSNSPSDDSSATLLKPEKSYIATMYCLHCGTSDFL